MARVDLGLEGTNAAANASRFGGKFTVNNLDVDTEHRRNTITLLLVMSCRMD